MDIPESIEEQNELLRKQLAQSTAKVIELGETLKLYKTRPPFNVSCDYCGADIGERCIKMCSISKRGWRRVIGIETCKSRRIKAGLQVSEIE